VGISHKALITQESLMKVTKLQKMECHKKLTHKLSPNSVKGCCRISRGTFGGGFTGPELGNCRSRRKDGVRKGCEAKGKHKSRNS